MVTRMIGRAGMRAARTDRSAADMSMPFYVAPEQQMKDRADFARKGIARGRSVIVMHYADGILFVAENRSQALHKVSEIYDRIGFAAVGRYNEFENLRTAGIRTPTSAATATTGPMSPAAASPTRTRSCSAPSSPPAARSPTRWRSWSPSSALTAEQDQIYRLTYDGSVADENDFAVMGGSADVITEVVGRGLSSRASAWPTRSSWR